MKNAGISRRSIVLAAAGVGFAGATRAQLSNGSQVVKILVGFPAGQATDIVARLLANKLPAVTGANYIVDNKPGQGGSLARGRLQNPRPMAAS